MAGDWIPYRKDLMYQTEVLLICNQTGLSLAEVIFRLLQLWCWADTASVDGRVPVGVVTSLSHPCPWLDRAFLDAVSRVGWIRFEADRVEFPNFERWMGNSAKKRLTAAMRKRHSRYRQQTNELASQPAVSNSCASGHTKVTPTVQNSTDTLSPLPSLSPGAVESAGVPSPPEGERETRERDLEKPGPVQPAAPSPASLRGMPCDHPEAAAAAKRVVDHYQRVVRPAHTKGGGIEGALVLLLAGQPEADLRKACDRYAAWCSRHNREPKYREAAKTFFGPTGQCGAFLEDDPEAAEQSAQLPPIHRAKPRERSTQPAVSLRELMERSKALKRDQANPVAQIEQEARSADKATHGQPETKEGSNER